MHIEDDSPYWREEGKKHNAKRFEFKDVYGYIEIPFDTRLSIVRDENGDYFIEKNLNRTYWGVLVKADNGEEYIFPVDALVRLHSCGGIDWCIKEYNLDWDWHEWNITRGESTHECVISQRLLDRHIPYLADINKKVLNFCKNFKPYPKNIEVLEYFLSLIGEKEFYLERVILKDVIEIVQTFEWHDDIVEYRATSIVNLHLVGLPE